MDNRLKFLYRFIRYQKGVTQEDRLTLPLVEQGQSPSGKDRQIRFSYNCECDGERNKSSEVADFTLARKASIENEYAVPQTDTGR